MHSQMSISRCRPTSPQIMHIFTATSVSDVRTLRNRTREKPQPPPQPQQPAYQTPRPPTNQCTPCSEAPPRTAPRTPASDVVGGLYSPASRTSSNEYAPPRSGSYSRQAPPRSGSYSRQAPPRSGSYSRQAPPRCGAYSRQDPRAKGAMNYANLRNVNVSASDLIPGQDVGEHRELRSPPGAFLAC